MTTELYLKLPGRKPVRVNVTGRRVGAAVVLDVTAQAIRFQLIGLAADFMQLANPVAEASPETAIRTNQRPNVLAMTAADVLQYFQNSPILSIYAEDLRTGVLKPLEAATSDFRLQNDIRAVEGLQKPTMADISEKLTGSRYYSGRTYKRVKQVYNAVNSSSSQLESHSSPGKEVKAA